MKDAILLKKEIHLVSVEIRLIAVPNVTADKVLFNQISESVNVMT